MPGQAETTVLWGSWNNAQASNQTGTVVTNITWFSI
jgi:hypothetical protein